MHFYCACLLQTKMWTYSMSMPNLFKVDKAFFVLNNKIISRYVHYGIVSTVKNHHNAWTLHQLDANGDWSFDILTYM